MKTIIHAHNQHPLSSAREGIVAIALIALVPIFVKQMDSDVFVIGFIRLAIAVLGLSFWYLIKKKRFEITLRMCAVLSLIGLFFGAHWLTYFVAIKSATPSIAVVGLSSYGIHLVLFNALLQKRLPSWGIGCAVFTALIGTLLVTTDFIGNLQYITGLAIGVASGFFYALLPLLHQKYQHIPLEVRTYGQFIFALLFFSLFIPFGDWHIPITDWKFLIILGVVCTLIGHALWVVASTKLPIQITSCLFYLGLPCTMLYEVIFMGTPFDGHFILGAAMIVSANIAVVLIHNRAS